jgi:hypothetical protein
MLARRYLEQRRGFGAWLLLAFVLRAWIPVGYMPAAGQGFALEICPSGLERGAALHLHHHHPGMPAPGQAPAGHDFDQHCPFGSIAGAAPPNAALPPPRVANVAAALSIPAATPLRRGKAAAAHAARAPPALA